MRSFVYLYTILYLNMYDLSHINDSHSFLIQLHVKESKFFQVFLFCEQILFFGIKIGKHIFRARKH